MSADDPIIEKQYKVRDVAQIFSVTTETVRNWINNDHLAATKLESGTYRIAESEVRRFANNKYGASK